MTAAELTLEPLDRRHLARTREWMNDPELSHYLGRGRPVADDEHERWFDAVRARDDVVVFALCEGADHIGNVWLWDIDTRHRRAELRVVLGPSAARGRGLGRTAIDMCVRYAFEQLNLQRVFAYVLEFNTAARRAFESAGFELEGTLRRDRWSRDGYVDVFVLGRLREQAS